METFSGKNPWISCHPCFTRPRNWKIGTVDFYFCGKAWGQHRRGRRLPFRDVFEANLLSTSPSRLFHAPPFLSLKGPSLLRGQDQSWGFCFIGGGDDVENRAPPASQSDENIDAVVLDFFVLVHLVSVFSLFAPYRYGWGVKTNNELGTLKNSAELNRCNLCLRS